MRGFFALAVFLLLLRAEIPELQRLRPDLFSPARVRAGPRAVFFLSEQRAKVG
jgi:hypothetical protein